MALWSVPDTAYDCVCLAEGVPSMEPLCTFSNISEPQPMDKVRDLAHSHQYSVSTKPHMPGACTIYTHIRLPSLSLSHTHTQTHTHTHKLFLNEIT